MIIFSVCCQKGGTGKTTNARTIAAGFAIDGYKTLLIDLDPQANASYFARMAEGKGNAFDLLAGTVKAADCIAETGRDNLFGIYSSYDLTDAGVRFKRARQDFILRDALNSIRDAFDVVVIDTPPSIGLLTRNALCCSNYAVIPVLAETASIIAFRQLRANIEAIQAGYNPGLQIAGVIVSNYSGRAKAPADDYRRILAEAERKQTRVFAPIRSAVAIKEADRNCLDIFEHAPKSAVCKDYKTLVAELETLIKKQD